MLRQDRAHFPNFERHIAEERPMLRPWRAVQIFILASACLVAASGAAELVKGDFELGASALLQDTEGVGFYLNIVTRVGLMLTENHEIGPTVAILYVKPDEGSSTHGTSLGAFYRYNFSTKGKLVIPFMGLAANTYTGALRDQLSWSWQVESGIRIMPAPSVSINQVLFWHRDYTRVPWITSERYFGLSLGVSLFL